MAESTVKSLWTKYMGTESEEAPPVAESVNTTKPGVIAVEPRRVVVENEQIESTPAYKMLCESVLSKVSPFTSLLKTDKSLESILTDSNQRLIAATKALESTGGYSFTQINQSITMHVGLLEAAKKKFEKDVAEQLAQSVGSLEKEHGNVTVSIDQWKAEIARMQGEIAQAETRQGTLGASIAAAKEKIESGAKTFNEAASHLENLIKSYQQKLGALPR